VKPPDLYLRGLGVYLPPDRIDVSQARQEGRCGREFDNSGPLSVCVATEAAPADMAVAAARQALARSGDDAGRLDLLIHAPMFWQGPEGWSAAGYLLRELGCGAATAFEVQQGCNGVLAGVGLAAGWLAGAPEHAVAAVTTALSTARSPTVDRWRSSGYGIALGDGAAALVLGRSGGFARVDSINSMTVAQLEALHRGRLPLTESGPPARVDVAARTGEFAATAGYHAIDLYARLVQAYRTVARRSLEEAGVGADELARVIFSNVTASLIETAIMQQLGLPMSRAAWDSAGTVGHIGSGDHIATLDELMSGPDGLRAGDRVLLASGTAGYHVASAVLTIIDSPAR
jgi:3-oxoacyl-[acyl-carrier-protein] synthase III